MKDETGVGRLVAIFFGIVVGLIFIFGIVVESLNCDGSLVRGVFWFKCVEEKSK